MISYRTEASVGNYTGDKEPTSWLEPASRCKFLVGSTSDNIHEIKSVGESSTSPDLEQRDAVTLVTALETIGCMHSNLARLPVFQSEMPTLEDGKHGSLAGAVVAISSLAERPLAAEKTRSEGDDNHYRDEQHRGETLVERQTTVAVKEEEETPLPAPPAQPPCDDGDGGAAAAVIVGIDVVSTVLDDSVTASSFSERLPATIVEGDKIRAGKGGADGEEVYRETSFPLTIYVSEDDLGTVVVADGSADEAKGGVKDDEQAHIRDAWQQSSLTLSSPCSSFSSSSSSSSCPSIYSSSSCSSSEEVEVNRFLPGTAVLPPEMAGVDDGGGAAVVTDNGMVVKTTGDTDDGDEGGDLAQVHGEGSPSESPPCSSVSSPQTHVAQARESELHIKDTWKTSSPSSPSSCISSFCSDDSCPFSDDEEEVRSRGSARTFLLGALKG